MVWAHSNCKVHNLASVGLGINVASMCVITCGCRNVQVNRKHAYCKRRHLVDVSIENLDIGFAPPSN